MGTSPSMIGDLKSESVEARAWREMVLEQPERGDNNIIENAVGALVGSAQVGVIGSVVVAGQLQNEAVMKIHELQPARVGSDLILGIESGIAAEPEAKWKAQPGNGAINLDELVQVGLLTRFETGVGNFGWTDLGISLHPQQ